MPIAAVPNTPAMAEFLAAHLSFFMAFKRTSGLKWTKKRVADYVTGSEQISGTLSDSTVGRFLDPFCSQAPSDSTIRLIAEFLLVMGAITESDLRNGNAPSILRLAGAISDCFGRTIKEATKDFKKSMQGHFRFLRQHPGYVLECNATMAYVQSADTLTIEEEVRLYRVSKPLEAHAMQRQAELPAGWSRIALSEVGGVELLKNSASGVVVVDDQIGLAIFQGDDGHFISAVNIQEIVFGSEDQVINLRVTRNQGWVALDEGQISNTKIITKTSRPENVLQVLSGEMTLSKIPIIPLRRGQRKTVDDLASAAEKIRYFTHNYFEEKQKENSMRKPDVSDIEDAVNNGDLQAFKAALDAGADPNFTCQRATLPVIFRFAGAGQIEWIEAALATGRLDLNVFDSRGLPASSTAGEKARRLAPFPGMAEQAKCLADTMSLLRAEEIRQEIDFFKDREP
ncbi:MAG: hypothetical protein ACPGOY_11535 [Rhodospirillaceae bacterium]